MNRLENKLTISDWEPASLFGDQGSSALPDLMGIMMRVPQLQKGLEEIKGDGIASRKLAELTQAWVSGQSLSKIADAYFDGDDLTSKISKACRAVYRDLANNAAWGISALSKLPTSGLDFDGLTDIEKRRLNSLPAMLYHGVGSEEGVLMRMNSVPRSIAEATGTEFRVRLKESAASPKLASEYLRSLRVEDWERLKPKSAKMSGADYQQVWKRLSGL